MKFDSRNFLDAEKGQISLSNLICIGRQRSQKN